MTKGEKKNGTDSSEFLGQYPELKNAVNGINEALKRVAQINTRLESLENELEKEKAEITKLKKTCGRGIKIPLKRIRNHAAPIIQKTTIRFHLFLSYIRLVYVLFLLFLKMPGRFLKKVNPSSLSLFLVKLVKMHPKSLEYEIRAKLGMDFMQDQKTDAPDNYFHMLAISKIARSVLVVDRYIPAHDKTSGALRMYSILKVLKNLGWRISFIPDNLQAEEPYLSDLRNLGIKVVYGNVNLETYFKENGPRFELVILSEPLAAINFISLVRAYAVNATLIYDTVDLHWVRLERGAAVTNNFKNLAEAEYFKKIEHFLIECSDIIFTVTQPEKDFLLERNPDLEVYVVPNVHDAVEAPPPSFSRRKDLMFIGHFLHQPNVDAMMYFVHEVLPILRQRLGQIKFYIVGSNPTEEVLRLQSRDVIVTGYVPDVTPYFECSRVFVAPLRFGAGMKGKIGQSMTFGLPIVTTSIGAEGMGLQHGKHLLVADDTDAFVDAVERLYTDEDLWKKLSAESKQYIHNTFSTSAMQSTMSKILAHMEK